LQIATAVDYTVGDEFGWSVPSSPDFYSDWVDEVAPFTEGDTLGNHNILDIFPELEIE
jgi:hypothetical protein